MAIAIHNLKRPPGAIRERKKIGRGLGSTGTYSGRGTKGQRARTGGRNKLKLKGLRKIMLSTPKLRGFHSQAVKPKVVNVGILSAAFGNGEKVTKNRLLELGLVPTSKKGVKILGSGQINKKLIIAKDILTSEPALKKILAAGGEIEA